MLTQFTLASCFLGGALPFAPININGGSTRGISLRESSDDSAPNANELFDTEGWIPIKKDLDQVPIFCCADEEGNPLAYSLQMKDGNYTVPFFFCDVDDALAEREKARENTGLGDKIDLIPYPMGEAFRMWATDEAVIVPSKQVLMQAGAPPNVNPIGQEVPLFACMDIMQEDKNGKVVLPLFMSPDEANAAIQQAVASDPGAEASADELEVVSLSLQKAVQLLATVPETPGFEFVAAPKSIEYIQKYLSDS